MGSLFKWLGNLLASIPALIILFLIFCYESYMSNNPQIYEEDSIFLFFDWIGRISGFVMAKSLASGWLGVPGRRERPNLTDEEWVIAGKKDRLSLVIGLGIILVIVLIARLIEWDMSFLIEFVSN